MLLTAAAAAVVATTAAAGKHTRTKHNMLTCTRYDMITIAYGSSKYPRLRMHSRPATACRGTNTDFRSSEDIRTGGEDADDDRRDGTI